MKTKKALARGGYGFVYIVQDMSKRLFALKIMERNTPDKKKAFEKEVEVMVQSHLHRESLGHIRTSLKSTPHRKNRNPDLS